jgi:1-pyrroline-5-carboxylate dehydrogenase
VTGSSPAVITYATTDSPELEEAHLNFEAALESVREDSGRHVPLIIGGKDYASGPSVAVSSPYDPQVVLANVATCGADQVDAAVRAGHSAFGDWGRRPLADRLGVLREAARILEERAAHIAAVLSLEVGKPRVEAFAEASEVPSLIRYYSDVIEAAGEYEGPLTDAPGGGIARMRLRPYGVWAVISPFNFPFATGAGMAAAALAAGNTVVLKPATLSPLLTIEFARALLEAGLPAGAVSVVVGSATDVAHTLVEHPLVTGVAFTGSVETGMFIARQLAKSVVRRPFLAELGGKNPVIVGRTADLDAAVEGISRSAFGFSGQKCSATSRVYVHVDVADELVARLAGAIDNLVVGDPTERGVDVGPVIDARAVTRFASAVQDGRRQGVMVRGGERVADACGYLVQPTLVANLPLASRLFREELFLPFLTVGRVGTFDIGLQEANAGDLGLCAGLFTNDEGEIERFFGEMESGVLYVNRRAGATSGAWPGVQSFTGWKGSGSTGKGALGPWYVQQFLREQAQTRV